MDRLERELARIAVRGSAGGTNAFGTTRKQAEESEERLARGPGGGNEHPWSSHGCDETPTRMSTPWTHGNP